MPRLKSLINLTPAQMLSKIKKSAKEAAYRGFPCSSKEELKRKRDYTDAQAELYLSVYAANKLSDEEQKLRKARRAAQMAARRSSACPTIEALKAKGYSDAQIEAYRIAYEAAKGSDEEQMLRKARYEAQVLAGQGYACPTVEILKDKGYSDAQIQAYRAAFEAAKNSDEEQAIKKVRRAAQTLASHGAAYPAIEILKAKGYNDAQIEAHRIAYEAAKGSDEEQAIRKARNAAQILASNDRACPAPEILKAKGYSNGQIEAYRAAYEAARGTDEEQAIKKARHDAQVKASHGSTCPTVAELKVKGYSDAQIEAYQTAYEASKGTDEEQAIRHARYNAQALARQGYACPTPEILKAKGYGDEQIQAYQAAHKAFEDTHEMPARSTLEYRDFNHGGEMEFMSDDSDEEAAILLFSSIQRSNTTSTLAMNATLTEQDNPVKTTRLT